MTKINRINFELVEGNYIDVKLVNYRIRKQKIENIEIDFSF